MRKIEFRVWDVGNKRMFNNCFNLIREGHETWVQLKNASNNLIWEQYTGLKDKNGKKIFEGDVLSDEVEVDGQIVKLKQQVFWNEKKSFWALDYSFEQNKSLSDHLFQELENFNYEIIGNIHENKELTSNNRR